MNDGNGNKPAILVLGAGSWLGYLLIHQLQPSQQYRIIGSVYKTLPDFNLDVELFTDSNHNAYEKVLSTVQPVIVINFLRGEGDAGLLVHKRLIEYCKISGAYYLFASSALALDAYNNVELNENLLARSVSPYGIFKAKCEEMLYDSNITWAALRFSSVQGWVPHKETRNEIFFKKLRANETIKVHRGVVQNRMIADLMVNGLVELIQRKLNGIIHFGTSDSSEEYLFLRKEAEIFGYSPDLIVSGEERTVNLNVIPNRIYTELGDIYRQTEMQTLQTLLQMEGLFKYKKEIK